MHTAQIDLEKPGIQVAMDLFMKGFHTTCKHFNLVYVDPNDALFEREHTARFDGHVHGGATGTAMRHCNIS
eukprot:SAG31_NODE_1548_length_7914_cov_5.353423_7_plen_71_part_00